MSRNNDYSAEYFDSQVKDDRGQVPLLRILDAKYFKTSLFHNNIPMNLVYTHLGCNLSILSLIWLS